MQMMTTGTRELSVHFSVEVAAKNLLSAVCSRPCKCVPLDSVHSDVLIFLNLSFMAVGLMVADKGPLGDGSACIG